MMNNSNQRSKKWVNQSPLSKVIQSHVNKSKHPIKSLPAEVNRDRNNSAARGQQEGAPIREIDGYLQPIGFAQWRFLQVGISSGKKTFAGKPRQGMLRGTSGSDWKSNTRQHQFKFWRSRAAACRLWDFLEISAQSDTSQQAMRPRRVVSS